MARNGSGTFSRTDGTYSGSTIAQQQKAAGVKVTASRYDTELQDIADGLTASLAKDGQTTPTANLPMGGYKHTNTAVASARTDYARASQVQDSSLVWLGTSSGTNTITASASPAITAYATGQRFAFKAGDSTTGAATLNINGVGAANIIKGTGTAMSTGDIIANGLYEVMYGGSDFVLLNSSAPRFSGDVVFATAGAGVVESVATVTAAGSDQSAATQLASRINDVTAGSGGVKLPATITVGSRFFVENRLGSRLNIYPGSGHYIDSFGINDPYGLAANGGVEFVGLTSTQWGVLSPLRGSVPDYTITNMGSSLRTIDFMSSDSDDVREILATLITDLVSIGIFR